MQVHRKSSWEAPIRKIRLFTSPCVMAFKITKTKKESPFISKYSECEYKLECLLTDRHLAGYMNGLEFHPWTKVLVLGLLVVGTVFCFIFFPNERLD